MKSMATYLTIDIGGTSIKYALIDAQQQLHDQQQVPTPKNVRQAILKQLEQIVQDTQRKHSIAGIGISTAGIVNRTKGDIIYAGPTIQNYQGTRIKKHLTDMFDLPVHVENDVNSALLGERWLGVAQNRNDVFCMTLGTGIGGAYYHHQLQDGSNHQANSIGYLLYDPVTQTNYEQRASTTALNQKIKHELVEDVSAKTVFSRARNGDAACINLIESWAGEIAKGLAQIILLLDPSCIIIGGGISKQGDFLLQFIREQVSLFLPEKFMKTELKFASLYNDAALYGAVYPFFKEAEPCYIK